MEAIAKVLTANEHRQSAWSERLNVRYVYDIINHVAAVHVDGPLILEQEASECLARFLTWELSQFSRATEFGYCNFAAFVAIELARGTLGGNQPFQRRVCMAVDFISHVLLENNLMNRDWRVEYKPGQVVAILCTPQGSAEQIVGSLRARRWNAHSQAPGAPLTISSQKEGGL